MSLSEGQQGTLGWLTVRVGNLTPCTRARLLTRLHFLLCAQTNERKVHSPFNRTARDACADTRVLAFAATNVPAAARGAHGGARSRLRTSSSPTSSSTPRPSYGSRTSCPATAWSRNRPRRPLARRDGTRDIPHAHGMLTWLARAWQVRTTYTGKLYGTRHTLTLRQRTTCSAHVPLSPPRQAGRPVHRHPAKPDRLSEGLRLPQPLTRPKTPQQRCAPCLRSSSKRASTATSARPTTSRRKGSSATSEHSGSRAPRAFAGVVLAHLDDGLARLAQRRNVRHPKLGGVVRVVGGKGLVVSVGVEAHA